MKPVKNMAKYQAAWSKRQLITVKREERKPMSELTKLAESIVAKYGRCTLSYSPDIWKRHVEEISKVIGEWLRDSHAGH